MASQIQKKFIADNAVGAAKVRLENNTNLRARNAANSADIDILKVDGSDKIVLASIPQAVGTPSAASDLTTVAYVQSLLEGLKPKAAVRLLATANITLSGTQTIDGVSAVAGDRVLTIGQTDPTQNGIYVVAAGAWSRSSDMNASAEFPGSYTLVSEGTSNAGKGYVCSVADTFVLGTDPVTFVFFKSAVDLIAGDGISITGQTIAVSLSGTPGLEFNSGDLQVQVDAAGAILRGASGLAVSLEASNPSLQISSNELGLKIDPAGAIQKGSAGTSVRVDAATVKINGSNNLESLKSTVETITLGAGDITNQYVDLAKPVYGVSASNNSVSLTPVGGPQQHKTVEYSVGLTAGAGGVTRITFLGDLATGGASELVAGDILMISYSFLT